MWNYYLNNSPVIRDIHHVRNPWQNMYDKTRLKKRKNLVSASSLGGKAKSVYQELIG